MKNKSCICGMVVRRGKEIGMIAVLCVFMALLGILFLGIGIVWELADWIVGKRKKDGNL